MKIRILYIGDDQRYIKTLSEEFRSLYCHDEFEITNCPIDDISHGGQFDFFVETAPDITFFDFS